MWYLDKKSFSWSYIVESEHFSVKFTGGSIIASDRKTGQLIKRISGFNYLYSGAIRPDESQFFALENGKHFYVYSTDGIELIKRITLPRGYESIDVAGFYSEDGKYINIPAEKYVYDGGTEIFESSMLYEPEVVKTGYYEYCVFSYNADNLSLVEKIPVVDRNAFRAYCWKYADD